MDKTMAAYCYDRLARACARGELMTEAQRADLADFIEDQGAEGKLAELTDDLRKGTLDDKAVAQGYKRHVPDDFDPDAVRASLAPPPDETRAVDARLRALIGGEE